MSILKTDPWALFCKGTFIIGWRNLFFGMCSSVPFGPRCVVSATSAGKFYLLFLPEVLFLKSFLRTFSGILNVYSKLKINPFVPNAPFFYPLKTAENLSVFWCFQGIEKGCIGNEWGKSAGEKEAFLQKMTQRAANLILPS